MWAVGETHGWQQLMLPKGMRSAEHLERLLPSTEQMARVAMPPGRPAQQAWWHPGTDMVTCPTKVHCQPLTSTAQLSW